MFCFVMQMVENAMVYSSRRIQWLFYISTTYKGCQVKCLECDLILLF